MSSGGFCSGQTTRLSSVLVQCPARRTQAIGWKKVSEEAALDAEPGEEPRAGHTSHLPAGPAPGCGGLMQDISALLRPLLRQYTFTNLTIKWPTVCS
jgi:hypothetical protein